MLSIGLFATELQWHSYKEIYNLSQDKKLYKPVFAFISSSNCKFCKIEMERIRKDSSFQKFLADKFELVYVEQDIDFTPVELVSPFTPTFFVLSPKTLEPLTSSAKGAIDLRELQEWLDKIHYLYGAK